MPDRFVSSASAYLPLLRLDRKAAIAALSWSGLGSPRGGRRSVAGWDEDAVTMAVEAARLAIGDKPPQTVVFASTSGPFRERLQAGILVDALGLSTDTDATDVAGSRRCGIASTSTSSIRSSFAIYIKGQMARLNGIG